MIIKLFVLYVVLDILRDIISLIIKYIKRRNIERGNF